MTEADPLMQQPPSDKGKRLKLYYITQVAIKPPTFVIFVNDKELMHFSYTRYLENRDQRSIWFPWNCTEILYPREKGERSVTMERLICLVIGYVFGLIQTGYLYGKSQHLDIRKYGSGNAGTTNVLRTRLESRSDYILENSFKCIIAIVLVHLIFGKTHADIIQVLAMYTGMSCTGSQLSILYEFLEEEKGLQLQQG